MLAVMSSNFQTVPFISWKICRDLPRRTTSLQRPVGENKRSGEVYRIYDVGGQKNERRKWIHLFEGVTAVIFFAAISEYDQMLCEEENSNQMMETKELFEWILKQPYFEKISFIDERSSTHMSL
ncbi:hypothetical protein Droror1_Dr00021652 [Drosera rotundifolia]